MTLTSGDIVKDCVKFTSEIDVVFSCIQHVIRMLRGKILGLVFKRFSCSLLYSKNISI